MPKPVSYSTRSGANDGDRATWIELLKLNRAHGVASLVERVIAADAALDRERVTELVFAVRNSLK